MNRRYQKGRYYEYRVIKKLRERGYYTVRSAGSKGFADVVAISGNNVFLIQVKGYQVREGEFWRLKSVATTIAKRFRFGDNVSIVLASIERGRIVFHTLWGKNSL